MYRIGISEKDPVLKGQPQRVSTEYEQIELNNLQAIEHCRRFTLILFGMKWYANELNKTGVINNINLALNADSIKTYLYTKTPNNLQNDPTIYNYYQRLDNAIYTLGLLNWETNQSKELGLTYNIVTSKDVTGIQLEKAIKHLCELIPDFNNRLEVCQLIGMGNKQWNDFQIRYFY